jgi:hypothetical protein
MGRIFDALSPIARANRDFSEAKWLAPDGAAPRLVLAVGNLGQAKLLFVGPFELGSANRHG